MKVKDLIEELQKFGKESEVYLRDWNEEWAAPITDFAVWEDKKDEEQVVYLG